MTFSMDLSGLLALSKDEFCGVRCILVGILTIPIMEKKLLPGDKGPGGVPAPDRVVAEADAEVVDPVTPEVPVVEPEGPLVQEAEHHANLDPDQAILDAALDAVDDDEFLRRDAIDEEAPDPIPLGEDHKAAAQSWLDVLQADRESYQKEVTDYLLQRIQVMEISFIENLPNKIQSTIVAGIQWVIARCSYHDFIGRRFHSDRGREFNDA